MLLLTEDNKSMATSKMLNSVLKIEFAGSNAAFKPYIKNCKDTKYILFIDSVPENISTKSLPRFYIEFAKKYNVQDHIFVYPIPCIEYFVIVGLSAIGIRFTSRFNWMDKVINAVINKQRILNYPPVSLKYKGTFKTFEKQCKFVLENCDEIFWNYNTENNDYQYLNEISFYLNDTDNLTVKDKAIYIAKKFPIALFKKEVNFSDHGIVTFNIDKLRENQIKYFNEYSKWLEKGNDVTLPDKWWE